MADGFNDDEEQGAFSRSPVASPFGKLDRECKTHLDEHTYGKLLERCAELGVLPGVLQRELLYRFVHGSTFSQLSAERMAQRLGDQGPFQGREQVS